MFTIQCPPLQQLIFLQYPTIQVTTADMLSMSPGTTTDMFTINLSGPADMFTITLGATDDMFTINIGGHLQLLICLQICLQ